MQTCLFLTRFTKQGIENVRESPGRTEAAREMVESLGGTWQSYFVTMGRYDGFVVAEFPDDETGAKAALGRGGNVSTETLPAFTLSEFGDIVEAMP